MCVRDREGSVHYVLGLTFDSPCSSVSKTKTGSDGHLMCAAIYCQSARGNKEQACYCSSPSRGPPLWKSLTRTATRGRDGISEGVKRWPWVCILFVSVTMCLTEGSAVLCD